MFNFIIIDYFLFIVFLLILDIEFSTKAILNLQS